MVFQRHIFSKPDFQILYAKSITNIAETCLRTHEASVHLVCNRYTHKYSEQVFNVHFRNHIKWLIFQAYVRENPHEIWPEIWY